MHPTHTAPAGQLDRPSFSITERATSSSSIVLSMSLVPILLDTSLSSLMALVGEEASGDWFEALLVRTSTGAVRGERWEM